ncbi:MAG: hypothetical protein QNJ72_07205 [Pleurocapsa sp. MO_226.B13]|nr:hypothetical protein [Pleurocapsa sp. MO_226.B13]
MMNNLTIQQFCQLETLKTEIDSIITAGDRQCRERIEGSLTVLEVTNSAGQIVQELILVV